MKTFVILLMLCAAAASAEVRYHPLTGRPMMLTVEGVSREHGMPAVTAERAERIAREFLEVNGGVFGVKDVASELIAVPVEQDRYGFSHVNFFQVHDGVEVIGGALYVHLNRKGQVYAVNGKFAPDLMLSTTPMIESEHAVKLALAQAQFDMQTMDSPIAKEPKLVLLPLGFIHNEKDDDVHLAWQVQTDEEVSSQSVTFYIDAQTGATLIGLDNVRHINRRIYDCSMTSTWNCNYQTYGRVEGGAPRGPCQTAGFAFGSNDVDSAYTLAGVAHEYVAVKYGLNGANNLGGIGSYSPTISRTTVRTNVDLSWSGCPNNALFSGTSGIIYLCLGSALADVFGHEYGHAIEYSAIEDMNGVDIGYQNNGQTGALGESGADIYGESIENFDFGHCDWCNNCGSPYGRDLANPTSRIVPELGSLPDRHYFSGYNCGVADNGGIHHNSTVASYACYLMTVGGEFNGCEFDSIGFEAVQQILYRAWSEYFTYTVTFAEAVTAFQQSCMDLYDATHPEYLATVTAALQAVEMDQPGLCSGIPEVAPACAVHGAGVVACDTTVYLGGNVIVSGVGGLAQREVTYYLSAHPAVDTIWAPINIYRGVMNRDTVELDGSLSGAAWTADTLGQFDIIVDENSDGFYQPWADTILTIQVVNGAVQELVAQVVQPASIVLTWRAYAGATQYSVEADSVPEFAQPWIVGTVIDTTFADSVSVGQSLKLFYRVRAVGP